MIGIRKSQAKIEEELIEDIRTIFFLLKLWEKHFLQHMFEGVHTTRWFNTGGEIFHNLGPTDSVLKPRFVIWLGIFRLFNVLRVIWLCPTGWYISDIYTGAALLKKLYILVSRHCSNLSLVGSQFILLNPFIPTWSLFPMFKQNLIHLFWEVCTFFFKPLFKLGYHARQAKS